jgi:hypothetical protein
MYIKSKTCDIQNWEKTFISRHILHQHRYSRLIALPVRRNLQHRKSFDCCLRHFCTSVSTSSPFREFLDPVMNRFTRQTLPTVNRKKLFMNNLCIEYFGPQKSTTERCSSVVHPQARSSFWLLKQDSEHAHVYLWTRLSWNWTVLLPSDTYRKPVTSITAILLPSVTYFSTLPRM